LPYYRHGNQEIFMKVALERGEVLEIALLEGNSVIGTLSLQLQANRGGAQMSFSSGRASASSSSAASQSAGASAGTGTTGKRGRRGRRQLSPEARERMRQAQLRRWAKARGGKK
jgi:hypothetical protein